MENRITYQNGKFSVSTPRYTVHSAVIGVDFHNRVRSVSTGWTLLSQQETAFADELGAAKGVKLTFETPEKLFVDWTGALYENGTLVMNMAVENRSDETMSLQALAPLCARGLEGGAVTAQGVNHERSVMLNSAKWMAFYKEMLHTLDPRKVHEAFHTSAFIDPETGKGLVFGMGERTNTIVRLEGSVNRLGFELSICGSLETDLYESPMELAPGKAFAMNRVVLMGGEDIWETLDRYGDELAAYLHIDKTRIRSASGIFCVYGQEKADTDDWEKIALTDERMDELMAVSDKYLRPYGLQYLKTQFGGASSGPSFKDNGLNIFYRRDWTDEPVWPVPEGETLADLIERDGFTPDTCDLKAYHPKGVKHMCDTIRAHGYQNALVCRPYINIKAGSDELEELAADLFDMTVKKWGYDYLMFDFNDADFETISHDTPIAAALTKRFQTIRDRVGPEVYIEACMIMPGCVMGIADSYRPAGDWRGGTEENLVSELSTLYFLHNKVFALDSEFFDPDITPFVWGNHGKINNRIRFLGSLDRVRSWSAWCAITGYNLFTGGVIDDVSEERWRIYTRMLPIYGPCAKPMDIGQTQRPAVWKLDAENCGGPFSLIGLFNWDSLGQKVVTVDYAKLRLDPARRYMAHSFWDGKVYELFDGMPFVLPASRCMLLRVRELAGVAPMLLGSDRHVTDMFGLCAFHGDGQTITGACEAPAGTAVTTYVYMPDNRGPASAEGCEWEIPQPGVIQVTAVMDEQGKAKWSLALDAHKKTV